MKLRKTFPVIILFFMLYAPGNQLFAQKDTEFWFAAPQSVQGGAQYDRPVVFRINSYDEAAIVTISQPANPEFEIKTISIDAFTNATVPMDDVFELIENYPENEVLNKGLLIESSSRISVYYEILSTCICNPEIFVLKGKKALGKEFYTPFQTVTNGGDIYDPLPQAAFDIVATEDATIVKILPSRDVIGHAANVEFTIQLQRGETYSVVDPSLIGANRPIGSRIRSDKPIAVTIKDDLIGGPPYIDGTFYDMAGDQLVPVENIGKKYVLQRGELSVPEYAFIVASKNGTKVSKDGVFQATLDAGKSLKVSVNDRHLIEATEPIYVLQLTGVGKEIATALVPSFSCNGSDEVGFVRSTANEFYIMLVTEAGNENGFSVAGYPNLIQPGFFSPVPGTNGAIVAAKIQAPSVIVNTTTYVKNSKGLFQLSFLDGDPVKGARFGYFSDFGSIIQRKEERGLCQGDSLLFGKLYITGEGVFYDTIINQSSCDTLVELTLRSIPKIDGGFLGPDTIVCSNNPITLFSPFEETIWNHEIAGKEFIVTQPGIVVAEVISDSICGRSDTIIVNSCCAESKIYFPSGFSPNGDGTNDQFCVFTNTDCQIIRWTIFDRWGNELFYSKKAGECWDGKFHGRDKQPGVYVWYAEIIEPGHAGLIRKSGDLTLVR